MSLTPKAKELLSRIQEAAREIAIESPMTQNEARVLKALRLNLGEWMTPGKIGNVKGVNREGYTVTAALHALKGKLQGSSFVLTSETGRKPKWKLEEI